MKAILFITFFTCFNLSGQEILDSLIQRNLLEENSVKFGKNKVFTKDLETEAFTAISFFEELTSTKIKLKRANINTSLNCRPTLFSLLFRKQNNRKYIVRVARKPKNGSITIDGANFNAKVGVLAHEFSHIIDYSNRDFWGILKRLLDYRSSKTIELYEKEIDKLTISKGLGFQLLEWSKYVLQNPNASEEYKKFKKEIYLEPNEIKEEMIN